MVLCQDVHCLVALLPVGVAQHVELHVYVRDEDAGGVEVDVSQSPAVVTLKVRLDDVDWSWRESQEVRKLDTGYRWT